MPATIVARIVNSTTAPNERPESDSVSYAIVFGTVTATAIGSDPIGSGRSDRSSLPTSAMCATAPVRTLDRAFCSQ